MFSVEKRELAAGFHRFWSLIHAHFVGCANGRIILLSASWGWFILLRCFTHMTSSEEHLNILKTLKQPIHPECEKRSHSRTAELRSFVDLLCFTYRPDASPFQLAKMKTMRIERNQPSPELCLKRAGDPIHQPFEQNGWSTLVRFTVKS